MLTTRILINRNLKRSFFESGIIRFTPVTNVFVPRLFSNSVKKNQSIDDVEKNFFSKYLIIENETIFSRKSSKVVKYSFTFLGFSLILLGTYVIFEVCKPEVIESEIPLWQQYLLGVWKQVQSFTLFIQEPSREKLLPDPVPYPYYQPPYTLVLEFTDVLAHPDWTYSTGWRFQKRPGLDYMLENLVGLYEIVVFTAEPGITIFPVIEAIDPKNLISYKLVRDSTHFVDGHHVKNLDKLNRDLKKVIVVDWNSQSLKFHPDNHLNIPRWKGENEDLALLDLTAFLKTIATTEIEDVRDVLKYYKNFENPLREFRNKQKEYLEQKNKLDQVPSEGPSIKRVFSYIM
ncbi:mitochondrial import inner membrane translocase subunit TIM50-C [Leptinotarsa decemlineata]|uniref:mitochondrial import inner membrane translocase subunit TIM50-C n=1 Tax=Leptinotarsa decemlineata TaxID=7539 RepID=UPI000C254C63|nr:mitochondrial import inner membrane translocase subunit TIM50-C-like [Leptinotarsa decemlineata]